ncbi:MAG: MaoC/PaaZ C-terminal domain-containing protein [Thermodesulfobacteriota bacterium]|nr:MaoC/PaaZ C-terminal domain-containing protein [Thermodesulfobacteriota bacterium]
MSKRDMNDIKVGDTFSASEEVDKYRTIYYAGASGDFNPIHIDPEFGKMVGLGGVILHGLCTFGFMTKTVTDWTGDPGSLKKIKCRFAKPVHLGDTVTTEARVAAVEGNRTTIELKVANQEGADVLLMASAEVEL